MSLFEVWLGIRRMAKLFAGPKEYQQPVHVLLYKNSKAGLIVILPCCSDTKIIHFQDTALPLDSLLKASFLLTHYSKKSYSKLAISKVV